MTEKTLESLVQLEIAKPDAIAYAASKYRNLRLFFAIIIIVHYCTDLSFLFGTRELRFEARYYPNPEGTREAVLALARNNQPTLRVLDLTCTTPVLPSPHSLSLFTL